MAAPIPASLKTADVSRFALRATQLEKAKPVVAYYCKYWMVNQILSKGLHTTNEEATVFTTTLMDQLEQAKAENANNDAITDDLAGKAYVEQFALETFQRADNAVRANKASRQTADTFQASATFLDLMQIWGPLEPEIAAKAKFAKFHALRIAKAIKAGEDPNLSNPKQEEPEPTEPPLDPNDPDVQMLNGQARQPSAVEVPDEADNVSRNLAQRSVLDESLHPSRASSVPRPPNPKVDDAPDDGDRVQRSLAQRSTVDESLRPSQAPSVSRPIHTDMTTTTASTSKEPVSPLPASSEDYYTSQPSTTDHPDVSPIGPSPQSPGNYFPRVPSPVSQPPAPPELPSAPSDFSTQPQPIAPPPTQTWYPPPPSAPSEADVSHAFSPSGPIPPLIAPTVSPPLPQAPDQLPPTSQFAPLHGPPAQQMPLPPPQLPTQSHYVPPPPSAQQQPPPPPSQYPRTTQAKYPSQTPSFSTPHAQATPPPPPATAIPAPQTSSSAAVPVAIVDEESMLAAQKHARWAISALNFEDVPTAVRELRGALRSLGAG